MFITSNVHQIPNYTFQQFFKKIGFPADGTEFLFDRKRLNPLNTIYVIRGRSSQLISWLLLAVFTCRMTQATVSKHQRWEIPNQIQSANLKSFALKSQIQHTKSQSQIPSTQIKSPNPKSLPNLEKYEQEIVFHQNDNNSIIFLSPYPVFSVLAALCIGALTLL